MSITSELNRLLQAKSDLATSITNKGVTVPAATTIDGYAALVDQIQQGVTPVLPYDAEVTYLKGDGNAYIKTGILFKDTVTFRSSIAFDTNTSAANLFGYRFTSSATVSGNMRFIFAYNMDNTTGNGRKLALRFGSAADNSTNRITSFWTECRLDFDGKNLMLDNNVFATVSARYSTTDYGEAYLFYVNADGYYSADLNKSTIYIMRFQIFDGFEMVRDYIPVRVGTVGYMYDKVSGELFGNANSTGAFIVGADKT